MVESQVFRVILSAAPTPADERRAPHAVVYVATNDEHQARQRALAAALDSWSPYAVGPVSGAPVPTEGIHVLSAVRLDPDARWAWEHHRVDFEVTDRWRLRRGVDLHEGGEPWWATLGWLRKRLADAVGADAPLGEVDDAALAEVTAILGT